MCRPCITWLRGSQTKGESHPDAKKLESTTITVPVPNHTEIRIGTLQSIIRQSGISRKEFEV